MFRGGLLPNDSTRMGLEEDGDGADDGTAEIHEHSPNLAALFGADTSGGGGNEATDLRRDDGVAMTEFALVVPVLLLLVAGMLGFGRVLFYWISANHLANETARWAVVDRAPTPRKTLQQYARETAARSSSPTRRFASPISERARPRPRRAHPGEDLQAVHARPAPPSSGRSRSAAPRPSESSDSRTAPHRATATARPPLRPGRAVRSVYMTRLRDERGGIMVLSAVLIPLFLLLTALVVDVGTGTRTSASCRTVPTRRHSPRESSTGPRSSAASPGTRLRSRTRRRRSASRPGRTRATRRTRRRPVAAPTGSPTLCGDEHGDREAGERRGLAELDELRRPERLRRRRPVLGPTVGDDVSDAGGANGNPQWIDVKVKEKDTVSLFGGIGLNLFRNTARARVELRPAKGISGFVPWVSPTIGSRRLAHASSTDATARNSAAPHAEATRYSEDLGRHALGAGRREQQPHHHSRAGELHDAAGSDGMSVGQDYVPITVEVRAAGRPDIDLDPPVTCATTRGEAAGRLLAERPRSVRGRPREIRAGRSRGTRFSSRTSRSLVVPRAAFRIRSTRG